MHIYLQTTCIEERKVTQTLQTDLHCKWSIHPRSAKHLILLIKADISNVIDCKSSTILAPSPSLLNPFDIPCDWLRWTLLNVKIANSNIPAHVSSTNIFSCMCGPLVIKGANQAFWKAKQKSIYCKFLFIWMVSLIVEHKYVS